MSDDVRKNWEDFLNPEVMRHRLITASIYLAAYEVLEDSVVVRIRDFFIDGYRDGKWTISPEYQADVLSTNKSPVHASLAWLKEIQAIDEADLETFKEIKDCRNVLAHELSAIISGEKRIDFMATFSKMAALLRKIEVWWLVNVEIPTNPDLDGKEIDEAGIIPGPVMTLQLMLEVALGDSEKAYFYLNEFGKRGAKP